MSYLSFKESRDGKIFFTSDTHFGSERTLELSKRPFQNVTDMDDFIVSRWNEKVPPNGLVFHLGDFGDTSFASRLNGRIILLYGNYERDGKTNLSENTMYFNSIFPTLSLKCEINGELYNLCHEPSNMSADCFNLFGHCHQLSMVKKHILPDGKVQCGLNVGFDIYHSPINLDLVKFYQIGIDKYYDEEIFY